MDDFVVALAIVGVVLVLLLAASMYFPYYPDGVPES